MAEKQDRERFEELTETLAKELQLAGAEVYRPGPNTMAIYIGGYRYVIAYEGYQWYLRLYGEKIPYTFETIYDYLKKQIRGTP